MRRGDTDGFECRRCGACCRVPGPVRLRAGETEQMAAYVGMGVHEFTRAYAELTRDRTGLTLIEKSDGSCVFLGEDGLCLVNPVKPRQCRDFPTAWRYPGWLEICKGNQARREPALSEGIVCEQKM